jgi:hypothetical protein
LGDESKLSFVWSKSTTGFGAGVYIHAGMAWYNLLDSHVLHGMNKGAARQTVSFTLFTPWITAATSNKTPVGTLQRSKGK